MSTHAAIEAAFQGMGDAPAVAKRCAELLQSQGICTVPDDWLVLERAGEQHVTDVLSEIRCAEKLTAMQVARLRLVLQGDEFTPPPTRLATAHRVDAVSYTHLTLPTILLV